MACNYNENRPVTLAWMCIMHVSLLTAIDTRISQATVRFIIAYKLMWD
jgi:hypothetical protein